jgi:hypothetical protein
MVFLISNTVPTSHFKWLQVKERDDAAILRALKGSASDQFMDDAVVSLHRKISDALATGLSRPPRSTGSEGIPLCCYAKVVRGIATGANEFFFLTRKQVKSLGLESRFFIRAVGRTRDCRENVITPDTLEKLEEENRPTWLLNLDGTPKDRLPHSMQSYLASGERAKLNERALIRSRRPWYKMEQRTPPPILFAYLGRRDCRFILNKAGVVPLTGFLCVYPHDSSPDGAERLWRALNHPSTLANLIFTGKSYGGGALKVEPRQLDMLEIPMAVLKETGLESVSATRELVLLEKQAMYGAKGNTLRSFRPHKSVRYLRPSVNRRNSRKT